MKKIILITGGGSGIGRETAVAFAAQKHHIILSDLNETGMRETAKRITKMGGTSESHLCDVSKRKDMKALAKHVRETHGALDVLINNAGIGSAGRFLEASLDTWDKVIDVNLKGVVHGCHYFLPDMVKAGKKGTVVNVSSMAGFFAAKEMPIYSASKFAVFGFSESLRSELAEHDIHVATICPGVINTPIVQNTVFEGRMDDNDNTRNKAVKFYQKRNYPPHKVAKAIVNAVDKKKSVVPVSPEAWATYLGKRFTPKLMEIIGRMDAPV